MTQKFTHDFHGQSYIIKMLRATLLHHKVPLNATEKDILILAQMSSSDNSAWAPQSAIFVGPGEDPGPQNPSRIIVFYDIERKITDVGVG